MSSKRKLIKSEKSSQMTVDCDILRLIKQEEELIIEQDEAVLVKEEKELSIVHEIDWMDWEHGKVKVLSRTRSSPRKAVKNGPQNTIWSHEISKARPILNNLKLNAHNLENCAPKIKKSKVKCEICDKVLSCRETLVQHIKNIHTESLKAVENCEICGLKFIQKNGLILHMKRKHLGLKLDGEPSPAADFAGNSNADKINNNEPELESAQHLRLSKAPKLPDLQNGQNGRKFSCKICSRQLKTAQSLKTHEMTHNKLFECAYCGRRFTNQIQVNFHQKFDHKSPKSFTCEICGRQFNLAGSLNSHRRLHNKNRPMPHKCHKCDYATDLIANYKIHMKSHERIEAKYSKLKDPVRCSLCPAMFRNNGGLATHIIKVHPKRLFECDLCGILIKTKSDTRKHIGIHLRRILSGQKQGLCC